MRAYVFSLLVMILSAALHGVAFRQSSACAPGGSAIGSGTCVLAELGLLDLSRVLMGTLFSLAVCFLLGALLYEREQSRAQRGKPMRRIWQLFQYGGGG